MLREALKVMLDVQELDIQMIRLTRLKRERAAELAHVRSLRDELHHQVVLKESEVIELKKQAKVMEEELAGLASEAQRLETQQSGVRRVEEFNALTHEISSLEREKVNREQRLSAYYDKIASEDDFLRNLKNSFAETKASCEQMETEIKESIAAINKEGKDLMAKRSALAAHVEGDIFPIYERLLQNRKDRVIVPLENRCCSGCHIVITPQHENLVRKGEKVVFCEHCSRIHYWQEHLLAQEEPVGEAGGQGARKVKRAHV